jgi:DNA-binding transcriptional LysR family regulator
MSLAHLSGIDLNLLLALHHLVEERNVTRAGKRLGLTQSATSRALARLRAHLKDEILVRSGSRMVLTPRASALAAKLAGSLAELDALLGSGRAFEPRSSTRTFSVATVDYAVVVVLPALLARLEQTAPGVHVAIRPLGAETERELETGSLDMVLAPRRRSIAAGLVWTGLFSDRFVTVAHAGHHRGGSTLTLERFCEFGHVVVAPEGRDGRSSVDDALKRQRMRRRIALRVPTFLAAPYVVGDSELLATLPERIARRVAPGLGLRIFDPPVTLPRLDVAMGWHDRMRRDPAHTWFRHLVASVTREIRPT